MQLLRDSLSVFTYTFELPQDFNFDELPQNNKIWEPSEIKPDKSKLLPHVTHFFNNEQFCKSYMLLANGAPNTGFWGQDKHHYLKAKDENGITYEFGYQYTIKRNADAPMLFLIPKARIGFLTISTKITSVEVGNDKRTDITAHDLMIFNYNMSRQHSKRWTPSDKEFENSSFENPSCENSSCENSSCKKTPCSFKELCALLLIKAGLENVSVKIRPHTFTYAQILDHTDTITLPPETFTRLMRVENQKYKVVNENPDTIKTFDNIMMGIGVEGGTIITCWNGDEKFSAIQNFKSSSVLRCYIWLYFMAVIQRETAISITQSLATQDISELLNQDKDITLIYNEYERLNHLKLCLFFPDVSDLTQINSFYQLCVKNFHISEYIDSIDSKINGIRSLLERIRDLYERQQDREERQNEKKLNKIIFGLTLLTIVSVISDLTSYLQQYTESILLPVISFLFVIGVSYGGWKYIQKNR